MGKHKLKKDDLLQMWLELSCEYEKRGEDIRKVYGSVFKPSKRKCPDKYVQEVLVNFKKMRKVLKKEGLI